MSARSIHVLCALATLAPALPSQVWWAVEQDQLLPATGAASDRFGGAVAFAGDYAVGGAHLDDDDGSSSGSASVFILDDSGTATLGGDDTWAEAQKLTASDAAAGDQLGASVAISVDHVVLGAPGDGDNGALSGSAYVFVRDDSGTPSDPTDDTWSQQDKLLASDGQGSDNFGISVSISGDTILVGAWLEDQLGSNAGAAYVFVRDDGGTPSDPSDDSWPQQAKLTASDGAASDAFGIDVAVDGDSALVGADGDDDGGNASGSAYVFTRSGTTWTQQSKLTASDAGVADAFGNRVDLDGDTAIAGARFNADAGFGSGSAYVFTRSGSSWSQQAKLVASDAAMNDLFGGDVAVDGDMAAIGARADDDNGNDSGSVYIFERIGSAWSEHVKVTASDGINNDQFGESVAVEGMRMIVGAHRDDPSGLDSGSAYAFFLTEDTTAPTVNCPADFSVDCADATLGAVVSFADPAVSDDQDPNPTVVCVPPSGTQLPVGVTTVTCTATDACGNVSMCTFDVTVNADVTPPTVTSCPTDVTHECGSPIGSFVFYNEPTATDDCDTDLEIECFPPSGALFAPGQTAVICTITDDAGNEAFCSFTVTIEDTTPPTITNCPPMPMKVECTDPDGQWVHFAAPNATDDCDFTPTVNCVPPSPVFVMPGAGNAVEITCTATDDEGNSTPIGQECKFDIIVEDTEAPTWKSCSGDKVVECTNPNGEMIDWDVPEAEDVCDDNPTLVPVNAPANDPALVMLGNPVKVRYFAFDAEGNFMLPADDCIFWLAVKDTKDPDITAQPMAPVVVEATGPNGAVVNYVITADDDCDDDLDFTYAPDIEPGEVHPLGTTDVTCTVSDDGTPDPGDPDAPPGNPPNDVDVDVTVIVQDTTPPNITACPGDMTVECQNSDGAFVSFNITADDIVDQDLEFDYGGGPGPGGLYPPGTTTVTCTVRDDGTPGANPTPPNEAVCTFDITVEDTIPPVINCPPQTVIASTENPLGTPVDFSVTASDACGVTTPVCTPPSGSVFPVGITTVSCTVFDFAGNMSQCTFDVFVVLADEPPPAKPWAETGVVGRDTPITGTGRGMNFQVLNNGLDVIYAGVGAGGTQVPRVDGLGFWLPGEDVIGNTKVDTDGDGIGDEFLYKQSGFRVSACVLGPPLAGLSINMPAVVVTEMTGRNAHAPDVFLKPGATTGGGINGLTSGGVLPYGGPNGSSVSFLLAGLPSGATTSAGGISSSQLVLLPNNGLIPSSRGGQAFVIAAASANLPINSTGFCWTVQFTWLNSALSPESLVGNEDHPDGWWVWMANGSAGNQYWGLSNDELNAFQSQSVALDGGATSLLTFFANVDFCTHSLTKDPVTNLALQPAGWHGTGVYYATSSAGAGSPPNGGFDLGRHLGVSVNGTGGVPNPHTGLGNQDPAGNGLGSIPSVGFVTWNNTDYGTGTPGVTDVWRITWLQFDWDVAFGIDPELAGSAPTFLGLSRVPISIPASVPAPWPQPFTSSFLPFYIHSTPSQLGNALWPDPDDYPGGSFGVLPNVGGSIHIPFVGFGPLNIGVPLAWSYGSSGMLGPGGPLTWNSDINAPSTGREIVILD